MRAELNLKEPKALNFPFLAVANNGMVVLFAGETAGTVLINKEAMSRPGTYMTNFTPVTDTDIWRILSPGESVTLIQE